MFVPAAALFLAATPLYPLSASVQVDQDRRAICQPGAMPENCDADVEQAARREFEVAVARMFARPPSGKGDLLLRAKVAQARLSRMGGFRTAEVEVRITLVSPEGREIDHFSVFGSQEVFEREPAVVAAAFDKAVVAAANDLPGSFANSEDAVAWLRGRGIVPSGSHILGPRRGLLVVFVDGGAGPSLTDEPQLSPFVQFGIGGRWFVLRGVVAQIGTTTQGGQDVSTLLVGAEAGPAIRLGPNWEVHGGVGLSFASGTLDFKGPIPPGASNDFSRKLPSAFFGGQYAFSEGFAAPARLRLSLEGRFWFDHDVVFESVREVAPVANFALYAAVWVEFPLIR